MWGTIVVDVALILACGVLTREIVTHSRWWKNRKRDA